MASIEQRAAASEPHFSRMQLAPTGVAPDVWVGLPARTKMEMVAGNDALATKIDFSDSSFLEAAVHWLSRTFPTKWAFYAEAQKDPATRETIVTLEVYTFDESKHKRNMDYMRTHAKPVVTFKENAGEFISETLYTKILLVCG